MHVLLARHLRRNAVAYLALFVALGGTSFAAVTVVTGKIVKNGSLTGIDVKNSSLTGADIRTGAVKSGDVGDGSLLAQDFASGQLVAGPPGPKGDKGDPGTPGAPGADGTNATINGVTAGGDLTGTYPNPSIAGNAVTGAEVTNNSLGGADIDEGTLTGLDAADGFDSFCDPQSTTFLDCDAQATITLGRTMNVLVIATSHFDVFSGPPAYGNCRLERNEAAVSNDHPIGSLVHDANDTVHQGGLNLVDIQALAAGTYTFEISCNEADADIEYRDIRVAAVELAQE